jgi:hypothetical protein
MGLVRGVAWSVHLEVMTPGQNTIAHDRRGALHEQVWDDGFAYDTLRVGPLLVHLPGGELVLAERSLLWWLVLCILLIFLVSLLLPLQVAKCIEVGLPALVLLRGNVSNSRATKNNQALFLYEH